MASKKTAKPAKKERIWDKFLTERDKAVFEAAGYGALAEWGNRPALLVIDVNYAFTGESSLPILESGRIPIRMGQSVACSPIQKQRRAAISQRTAIGQLCI